MKINDAIFGVIFAVLGAVVLVHVQSFPTIPGQQYGPGLFPGVVAAGFVACGVLLILKGLKHREGGWIVFGPWFRSRKQFRALVAIVLGIAAYILLADRIGFLLIAPVLLFVWQRALGVRWTTAVVTSLLTTAVIWYVFYRLLRVPLPWGVLTPYAF